MKIKIYRQDNTILTEVTVLEDSVISNEIRGEHTLSLSFSIAEYVEIPEGAYVILNGTTYTLLSQSRVTMNNTRSNEVTAVFEAAQAILSSVRMRNPDDGTLSFPYTATASDHLSLIIANLNRYSNGNEWTVGECVDDGTVKFLQYDYVSCLDALNSIADIFGTEWEISGTTVSLHKVEYNINSPLELEYGKMKGLRPGIVRETAARPLTRIYTQGGSRNIDASQYGSAILLLPKSVTFKYDGNKFEDEAGFDNDKARTYTTDSGGTYISSSKNASRLVNEGVIDCTDIYPSATHSVIGFDYGETVPSWVTLNVPENLDYSQYVILGELPTVTFQSGNLQGKTFEIRRNQDGSLTISKEYTELGAFVGWKFMMASVIENGMRLPDLQSGMVPENGDTCRVFGVKLPAEYICDNENKTGASWDMLRRGITYLYEYEDSIFSLKVEIDPIWARTNWGYAVQKFRIGGYVKYINSSWAQGGVMLRIQSIRQGVSNPYSIEIELGNGIVGGGILKGLEDKISRQAGSLSEQESSQKTLEYNVSNIGGNFVTLDTEQTVTAKKTFAGDVVLGGQRQDGSYGRAFVPSHAGPGVYDLFISSEPIAGEIPSGSGGIDETELWSILGTSGTQQIDASHMSSALAGYATRQWVQQQGYLTSSALTPYATKEWVEQQGYLKSVSMSSVGIHASWQAALAGQMPDYATSEELSSALGDYYTSDEVDDELAKYVTLSTVQTVSGKKTFSALLTASGGISGSNADLAGYLSAAKLYVPSYNGNKVYDLYVSNEPIAGEAPSGSGGLDEAELWSILTDGGSGERIVRAHLPLDAVYEEDLTSALGRYALKSDLDSYYTKTDADGRYVLLSSYTEADVLAKLLTVDGSGSGLDADMLDGTHKSGLLTAVTSTSTTNLSVTVGGTVKSVADLHATYLDGNTLAQVRTGMSFLTSQFSAAGWYRVFTSSSTNSDYPSEVILHIGRNYYSPENENYTISICVGYNGDISITQLSGVMGGHLITKIRVVWDNSQVFHIDIYSAASGYNNIYGVTGQGYGTFYAFTPNAAIPSGYTSREFTTADGCKSDRGFTGTLSGNASSATKLATARTLWGQSFDGTANVSGDMVNVGDITMLNDAEIKLTCLNSRKAILSGTSLKFDYSALTGGWTADMNVTTGDTTQIIAGAFGSGSAVNYLYYGGTYTSPRMAILPSGNVGIGTTAPAYKLDVAGKIRATTGITIGSKDDIGWYYTTDSRICAGQTTARGVNVGSLLVSNVWNDYTKVPDNGIYSKGDIWTGGRLYVPSYSGNQVYDLYISNTPVSGEAPSGSSGIDEAELWSILTDNAGGERIAKAHLPLDTVYEDDLTSTLSGYAKTTDVRTYTLTKSGSTITLTGSDGSKTSVTDSNTTYSLSSFGITATAAEINKLDGVGTLLHSGNIGSYALTPSNYTATLDSRYIKDGESIGTVYIRGLVLNGTSWNVLSNINSDITGFYAPTAAGTIGYVLQSTGGTPAWAAQNTLVVKGIYERRLGVTAGDTMADLKASLQSLMAGSLNKPGSVGGVTTNSVTSLAANWSNDSYALVAGSRTEFLRLDGYESSTNGVFLVSGYAGSFYRLLRNDSKWLGPYTLLDTGNYTATLDGRYLLKSTYTASDVLAKLKTVDGAGSGLDADLLDGYHAASFAMQATDNNLIAHDNEFNFIPSGFYDNIAINFRAKDGNGTIPQYRFYNGQSSLASIQALSFIGSLDGNASSATKLQNARTLWGQSFNGTGNVSGAISSTGNITPSAAGSYNIGTASLWYERIYGRYIDTASGYNLRLCTGGVEHLSIQASSGNVGIGTTSPAYKLDVAGTLRATGQGTFDTIKITDNTSAAHLAFGRTNNFNYISLPGTSSTLAIAPGGDISGAGSALCISNSATYPGYSSGTRSLGTSSYRWSSVYSVAGNFSGAVTISSTLTAGGNVIAYSSSSRLVKDILPAVSYSRRLKSLGRVVEYRYNGLIDRDRDIHTGLLYENVRDIMPSMCFMHEGYGALNYLDKDYICTIAGAVQENIDDITSLKNRVASLEAEVERLRRGLAA